MTNEDTEYLKLHSEFIQKISKQEKHLEALILVYSKIGDTYSRLIISCLLHILSEIEYAKHTKNQEYKTTPISLN
jgi:hypothetical protein